ncbi:MAG TPA: ATP synthase subunit I [Vicinamibacterales bacterium]|nr:ATP synthase subunit I [Vicinamibacterales bacterium]
MNDTLTLALAGLAGGALGAIFFGGLWWTVRRGIASTQPALWFLGSVLLRTSVALGGFYVVGGRDWERTFMCLLGFIAARVIATWLSRVTVAHPNVGARPARHAP